MTVIYVPEQLVVSVESPAVLNLVDTKFSTYVDRYSGAHVGTAVRPGGTE